ncbi:TIGR02270 family protein [Myxococcus sp. Y35]|uniref:TIGR02270 family protein n=1 Tax=Pseudomyxococcus flavus TaxID=3115648 RepID=UPI003CEFE915
MAAPALSDELFLNWESYEEQLGEAEFHWAQRERQLDSPEYRLPQLREREERLLASEDMLVLGGAPVAWRLLVPALESETPARIAAATHALLLGREPGIEETLLKAMEGETEGVLPAMASAMQRADAQVLPSGLSRLLTAPSTALQATVLEVLGAHGAVPVEAVLSLLEHEDSRLVATALRVLVQAMKPPPPSRQVLEQLLAASEPEVRDGALEWGLVTGQRAAWAACAALLCTPDARLPRLLWALGADEKEVLRLVALLDNADIRPDALWALGFSGWKVAMEACLPWMSDEAAALAGEAFSAMTGLRLEGRYTSSRIEDAATVLDENPEADVRRGMEELLPLPHVQAVTDWWRENHARFSAGQRYLQGSPWAANTLLDALEATPLRRRHALALDATLRSRGAVRIPTRGWVHQQVAALRAARALGPRALARPFTEGLS